MAHQEAAEGHDNSSRTDPDDEIGGLPAKGGDEKLGYRGKYQASSEAGTENAKGKAAPFVEPVRNRGGKGRPPCQAEACGYHNPIEEIEVPLSGSRATEGYTASHHEGTHW